MAPAGSPAQTTRQVRRAVRSRLAEKRVWPGRGQQEAGDRETLVTFEFHDVQGPRAIVPIHERFPSPEEGQTHSQVGTGCRDQLAQAL